MYMIFPSGATTKMNPSRVCNKYDPSSFIGVSLGFGGAGVAPQASPKPERNIKIYGGYEKHTHIKNLRVISDLKVYY